MPELAHQVEQLVLPFLRAVFFFLDPTSPLYWPCLVGTLLFGSLGWWIFERRAGDSLREFPRRHFSAARWWHASARADYRYYLVNTMVYAFLVLPLVLSAAWISDRLQAALRAVAGTGPGWSGGAAAGLAYTLAFFVAYDFGRWLAHSALHDVPLLWPFHKVHHTAEVLTPITAFRVHPVDLLWTQSVANAAAATVTALFAWLFRDTVSGWTFLGANAVIGATALLANLKHMQVWMTYGPLDRWWISPAHHQIHHSANPAHWGKNRGFELAIWDRLYGSLHVPSRACEVTALGLGDGSESRWHSVLRMYALPFVELWQRFARRSRPLAGSAVLVLALLASGDARADEPSAAPATVEIERMTWPELAAQIKAGATTVLLPIGGLEQNGPAMALAKHNEIVRSAAAEIARRAGRTLVAPVLPFSPEGGFAPRAGNQQWPGTVGLREATLAAVLEDEITSLALAGFTRIALLGDHGGSQAVQRDLVAKFAAPLATRGVQLLSLDRYYEPASLAERLKALGVDAALAGEHAGLVDTSELLSVAPELIRKDRLDPKGWTGYAPPGPGGSGRPDLATAALGQALLEQKISAAVAQLRNEPESADLAR